MSPPLPSGHIAPALLVRNYALQNVLLPPAMITFIGYPMTIDDGNPIRILTQTYHGTVTFPEPASFGIDFRLATTGVIPNNKMSNFRVDNTTALVPDQPQWKTDELGLPSYSIRYTSISGSGTPVFDFPDIDVWEIIGNSTTFGMERPTFGTTEDLTFHIQIAETADTDTILGEADWTLRYTWQ